MRVCTFSKAPNKVISILEEFKIVLLVELLENNDEQLMQNLMTAQFTYGAQHCLQQRKAQAPFPRDQSVSP